MGKSKSSSQSRKLVSKTTAQTPASQVPQNIDPDLDDDELEEGQENIEPDADPDEVDVGAGDDDDGDGDDEEGPDDNPGDQEQPQQGENQPGSPQNGPDNPDSPPAPQPTVHAATDAVARLEAAREKGRREVRPPKGRIIRYGEPVTVQGTDVGPSIVVNEDTYQEIFVHRSNRPTYVLKFRKGTRVAKTSMQPIVQQ